MKLTTMTCPRCGASLEINPEDNKSICECCGASILVDDGVVHVEYDNAEEAGYKFEKGRQRAKAEAKAAESKKNFQRVTTSRRISYETSQS